MKDLRSPFRRAADFKPSGNYRLLPFRFSPLDADRHVLTNDVGEYVVLRREELDAFVERRLDVDGVTYRALKTRHFLFDDESRVALDLLALKYRTRRAGVAQFTGLHLFVTTLRCDYSCHYCQVSRQPEDRGNFDMTRAHADKALEHVFRSHSKTLKIEFQGGEPLLNFDLVRHVVLRAKELNQVYGRHLAFVIVSNLSHLTEDILTFCAEHGVLISTSLDGPRDLHDKQRPRRGGDGFERTVDGIRRAQAVLGSESVSALMTTTPAELVRSSV